jgi:hydroxymethylbilane synthase
MRELAAERAAVTLLEASCTSPIGVYAQMERVESRSESQSVGRPLVVEAFIGLPDGSEWVRDRVEGEAANPAETGELLAERLLATGARDILDRAEKWSGV